MLKHLSNKYGKLTTATLSVVLGIVLSLGALLAASFSVAMGVVLRRRNWLVRF